MRWKYAELIKSSLFIIFHIFPGVINAHIAVYQLKEVLIPGDYNDIVNKASHLLGYGAYDIVGLKALYSFRGNAEKFYHLFYHGELFDQVLWCFRSVRLICLGQFLPESGSYTVIYRAHHLYIEVFSHLCQ